MNLDETLAAYIGFGLLQALNRIFPHETQKYTGLVIFINGLFQKTVSNPALPTKKKSHLFLESI